MAKSFWRRCIRGAFFFVLIMPHTQGQVLRVSWKLKEDQEQYIQFAPDADNKGPKGVHQTRGFVWEKGVNPFLRLRGHAIRAADGNQAGGLVPKIHFEIGEGLQAIADAVPDPDVEGGQKTFAVRLKPLHEMDLDYLHAGYPEIACVARPSGKGDPKGGSLRLKVKPLASIVTQSSSLETDHFVGRDEKGSPPDTWGMHLPGRVSTQAVDPQSYHVFRPMVRLEGARYGWRLGGRQVEYGDALHLRYDPNHEEDVVEYQIVDQGQKALDGNWKSMETGRRDNALDSFHVICNQLHAKQVEQIIIKLVPESRRLRSSGGMMVATPFVQEGRLGEEIAEHMGAVVDAEELAAKLKTDFDTALLQIMNAENRGNLLKQMAKPIEDYSKSLPGRMSEEVLSKVNSMPADTFRVKAAYEFEKEADGTGYRTVAWLKDSIVYSCASPQKAGKGYVYVDSIILPRDFTKLASSVQKQVMEMKGVGKDSEERKRLGQLAGAAFRESMALRMAVKTDVEINYAADGPSGSFEKNGNALEIQMWRKGLISLSLKGNLEGKALSMTRDWESSIGNKLNATTKQYAVTVKCGDQKPLLLKPR